MKSNARKAEIKKRLRELIPRAPMEDFRAIEEIASAGHLRHLPASIALWQAVTTRVRHAHTEYDAMLEDGYDAESSRHFVLSDMNDKLAEWGCIHTVSEEL